MIATITLGIVGFLFGTLVVWLVYSSVVIVGGDEIAILERKYFGKKMSSGRVIAMTGEVGIMGKTLGPGLHFLIPFLYSSRKERFTVIKEEEIGIIEAIDGEVIEQGKIFAKIVPNHNHFQDAEAFLSNGGQKGPQLEILPPGYYRINTSIFKVRNQPLTRIEKGNIGVVTSTDGIPIKGRLLGGRVEGHANYENAEAFLKNGGQRGPQIDILLPGSYRINTDLFKIEIFQAAAIQSDYVGLVTAKDGEPLPPTEFVAKIVDGHNNFQDAQKFLDGGGQRGPQFDVLKPGTYYINPLMFTIELDKVCRVERGQVAVLISNVGAEPPELTSKDIEECEKRLDKGIERYVVSSGFRGVQKEVSGPGVYYLNRRSHIPYIIDTTNITIDWDSEDLRMEAEAELKQSKTATSKSAEVTKTAQLFDPLTVVSRDGFTIKVSVKVVIRVRPDQAPYMVAKIGSTDNLIKHVIHPMIDSSFRNQASSSSAMNFLQDRQDEQLKAETRAKEELAKYHVECVSVLICQIILPTALMETQTAKIIAEQQKAMYKEQQLAEQERINTAKTTAEADKQKDLMAAMIDVKIAGQTKEATILKADGEGQAIKLKKAGEAEGIKAIGEAEGAAILAKGSATAKSYELQKTAIGGEGVTAIEVSKQIATGNVKVTPDFLINGSGSPDGLLSAWLTKLISPPKVPHWGEADASKMSQKTAESKK